MTDLKSKTVEELLKEGHVVNWYKVAKELARRLEEAQQAPPVGWVRIVERHSGLVAAEDELPANWGDVSGTGENR